MASADSQHNGRVATLFAALSSARSRRDAGNAAAALLVAAFGFAVIAAIVVLWGAAILSLAAGPTGSGGLAVVYAVYVVAMPVPMLWAVQSLSALQHSRLRATLGVEIPASHPVVHRPWPIGPWRAATTWRQLGFHLSAVPIGGLGGVAVTCWLAPAIAIVYVAVARPSIATGAIVIVVSVGMLLGAPWIAARVARADETSARKLLGPSRSDALAEQVESLARSRADIVAATDAERRRIERDLHDGAQQRLVSLAMNLGNARATLTDLPEQARRAIVDAHEEAMLALTEMREFIRGLHPAVLNDRGLDAALSGIVAHAPVPVRLRVDVPRRCSPSVEAIAYFIVSEALTNVAKYASATRAEVTLTRTGDRLRIVVTDDGHGGAGIVPGTAAGGGTGLRGLAQRAASVDGTLAVDSPPGGPTTIIAELPCES